MGQINELGDLRKAARVLSEHGRVNRRTAPLELDSLPFVRLSHCRHRRALLPESLWNRCLRVLESELPMQQFNTWVRPLQAIERDGEIKLLAPNRYVIEWLGDNSLPRIKELIREFADGRDPRRGARRRHAGGRGSRSGERIDREWRPSGARLAAAQGEARGPPCSAAASMPEFHLRQLRRGQEQPARQGGRHSGGRQPGQGRTTRCSSTAASVWARRT